MTLGAVRNVKTKGNLGGDLSGAVRQERKQVLVVCLEVSQSQHANPEKSQQSVVSFKVTRKLSAIVDKSVGTSECFNMIGSNSYNSVSQTNMESRLLRLSKKPREKAQPTEDVVADMLEARNERMLNREAVMSANLLDLARITGSITRIGEK